MKLCRSSCRSAADFVSSYGTIKTPAYTLDDIWDKFGPFDLIKIDVEGSEVEVIKGLSQVPKYLVIEVRPQTYTYIKKFLLNHLKVVAIERLIRGNAWNIIAKNRSIDC